LLFRLLKKYAVLSAQASDALNEREGMLQ
jgi:hypothetical protein